MIKLNLNRCALASILFLVQAFFSHEHAYLYEPPSRSSAWLVDKDFEKCCKNYDYNQMYCGGFKKQWEENGGKCGICGDAWDEPRSYEKGGDKYLGKIVRNYTKGSGIDVTVRVTANHLGFFEFRLCNIDGWETDATQECLNQTLLFIENTGMQQYVINNETKISNYRIGLPKDLTCNHCVLQWKYTTGNSWGFDPAKNISCVGCGPVQEQFYGCADISIQDPNSLQSTASAASTTKPTSTVSTTATSRSSSTTSPSTTSSSRTSSMHVHTTESQVETASSTKRPATTEAWEKCSPKLEYGSFSNLIRVTKIFCDRVCDMGCSIILKDLNDLENSPDIFSNVNTRKSLIVCLTTCPILCDC